MTHQDCQEEGAGRGGHDGGEWGQPGPENGQVGGKRVWQGHGHHWEVLTCQISGSETSFIQLFIEHLLCATLVLGTGSIAVN